VIIVTEDETLDLIEDASEYLIEKNRLSEEKYQIGSYARYHYDQETEELIWSTGGVPKVAAKIQFVGSISKMSNTWLWSWANDSVLTKSKRDIYKVKAFGEKHSIRKLIDAKWSAEEVDGWEMAGVAAKLLDAAGAYKSPDTHCDTFLIYSQIDWVRNPKDFWRFDQPKNCAAITVRQIIHENHPVLYVTHDADDHGWQFLTLDVPRQEDGKVVALGEMIEMDPTLNDLADLPPGWHAWRKSPRDPWIREVNEQEIE